MARLHLLIPEIQHSKLEVFTMSKGLSLWFAVSSIVLLTAAAISISYSAWLAILLGLFSVGNIGWGFVVKARQRRS
ncbi:hypothetical protein [Paenibacillus kribbensis]|uniref:hypothetical protein n=1 Tax=Paenibacillus kribbensis TaxID=172713 RepID=UPI00114CA3F0|nr:hypothetical protein [Paenibacillus kribbensis]